MGTFTAILACLMAFGLLMLITIEELDIIQFKRKKYKIQDEMNMLNEAKWIERVTKSCKTYKQLVVARKLRHALFDKYKNKVDQNLLSKIIDDLYWNCYNQKVTYD